MVEQSEDSKGLSLSHVAKLLGTPARQVQYLREQDVLVPSVIGRGRGGRCYYTFDEVFLAYVLLTVFGFLKTEGKRKVVEHIKAHPTSNSIEVGKGIILKANLRALKKDLQKRYDEYVTRRN
jgi:hypothetical protein